MRMKLFLFFSTIILLAGLSVQAIDFSKGHIFDFPEEKLDEILGQKIITVLSLEERLAMSQYRFDADTFKLLAILVDWENRPGEYPAETFDSLVFLGNVYPPGSVADYFDEVSYGQMTVTGDIYGWYNAGTYPNDGWFEFEDLLPDLDQFIDFSQYDGDHDGNVDAVIFIRSGTGSEDTRKPEDIWSFAYIYTLGYGPGPFDGMMVSRWCTCPELRPLRVPTNPRVFSGVDSLNTVRVFCHELSHNMGLPDLYDYDNKLDTTTYFVPDDNNDHPVYDWDIMGYGGYGLFSLKAPNPQHLCGWSKKELGWIEAIPLVGTFENLVLYNIETYQDNSLYMLPIDLSEGEYFLLEYRNPRSAGKFDKVDSDFSCFFAPRLTYGADTLDRGLLIMHVHDSLTGFWGFNDGTPSLPHYSVKVMDIGYNPDRTCLTNPEGHVSDTAQWWYPFETRKGALFSDDVDGQDFFGPETYPNSDGYDRITGIEVRVDSIVDDKLYAYVYNPYPDEDLDGTFDDVDNCLNKYNPFQYDIDADGVGDSCDNCIYDYNPGQEDDDEDNIGNACEGCCVGVTGNVDCSEEETPDISDIVRLIDYLYLSHAELCCPLEADVNKSGGEPDISDIVRLIDYLYLSHDPLAECP